MSTAKSMATLYLNGKRNGTLSSTPSNTKQQNPSSTLTTSQQQRFKSSTSNLAGQSSQLRPNSAGSKTRLKSTSMTNLVAGNQASQQASGDQQQQHQLQVAGGNMQRPVSRNALDSIHNGMNAKYAQVQSKVYLQNIKPSLTQTNQQQQQQQQQQQSKIPGSTRALAQQPEVAPPATSVASVAKAAAATRLRGPAVGVGGKSSALAQERSLLVAKLKVLEDELASLATERENLRQELEREKGEKGEQVQQLKLELQEKLAEHDRQNEEYHKKLLEAYELADQNRRAADSVLSESRQRDEESRKKIELLEGELNELKEFVSMKEEMMGKMYELREQLRQERERYEEQLKSLHQVFESEKISHEEELMLKAKHSMLLKQHSIKLDENSNSLYFNRIKPALEDSSESINKQQHFYSNKNTIKTPQTTTGCRQCQSGSSQLHKSEQDIYGSKMSTRMQDTANRAWKASRKFASSVITGGVNLSACRQCTKRGGASVSSPPPGNRKLLQAASEYKLNCAAQSAQPEEIKNSNGQLQQQQQQHTSVIKVNSAELETGAQQRSPVPQRLRPASSRQQQPPIALGPEGLQHQEDEQQQQQQQLASLITVDQNNKLTIVTKFNDSECQIANGPETMGASSSVSERSRCESSSSGRGTSSDAGSAASQNGDDLDTNNNNNNKLGQAANRPPANCEKQGKTQQQVGGAPTSGNKGHKRRSSLFKAGKILSGSQVSLHKLKSLFQSKGAGTATATEQQQSQTGKEANQQQQQQQANRTQQQFDHLEASRLRCMELNQAISVTSIGGAHTGGVASRQQQQVSVSASGGGNESKDAFETTMEVKPPPEAVAVETSLTGKAMAAGHGEAGAGAGQGATAPAADEPVDTDRSPDACCRSGQGSAEDLKGAPQLQAVSSNDDEDDSNDDDHLDDHNLSGQQQQQQQATKMEQPMAALRVA